MTNASNSFATDITNGDVVMIGTLRFGFSDGMLKMYTAQSYSADRSALARNNIGRLGLVSETNGAI